MNSLTPASSCFVVSLLSCCWNSRNPSPARRKTFLRTSHYFFLPTMRWGSNNSYYVRRRAMWKEMLAKISALVKIPSIIVKRYICLLLCLSPKCNNGENKFALRWNETRGWYLLVFVARPCLPCQSRLRSALPVPYIACAPAISPPPPIRFYHDVGVSPPFSLFLSFLGRQLEAMEGPHLVTRFHRDEDPTGGGLLRQEEAVADGQRAEPNCKAPSQLIKRPH